MDTLKKYKQNIYIGLLILFGSPALSYLISYIYFFENSNYFGIILVAIFISIASLVFTFFGLVFFIIYLLKYFSLKKKLKGSGRYNNNKAELDSKGKVQRILEIVLITGIISGLAYFYVFFGQIVNESLKYGAELDSRLSISSDSFVEHKEIPKVYMCSDDVHPSLEIKNIPVDTKELALIIRVTKIGGSISTDTETLFVSWGISPDNQKISENDLFPGIYGENSFSNTQYDSFCPPNTDGERYKFNFSLYALKDSLDLNEGATEEEFYVELRKQTSNLDANYYSSHYHGIYSNI
jgi:phosphatidylethanolamine-binding protein (PEBP) family uncharacterized protein